KYVREYGQLEEIVGTYKEYKRTLKRIEETREMLSDEELKDLAAEELEELKKKGERLEKELEARLNPQKKFREGKNIIMEIRAGTGGNEASIFTRDLFRMYSKYAERKKWRLETINSHPTGIGGFKEIIFLIEGKDAYRKLGQESGVHRVQRIPVTESGGRIHTSTVTVAVLPEPEEVEVQINPQDLRIDTFRSSSAGGQHLNVTDSAVRIAHLPSGIIVECQDERSQHKNKAKALRVLRARLLDHLEKKKEEETARERKSQIGTGERSEKIRTYNFPQNRVTDHRIGLTLHKLESILDGDLDQLTGALSK
ncbi:unnamed protein product, partial [marine sediment metagenome]